jgi:phosphoglycolate phosphatase-like HAD superfamily hydrolase
LAGMHHIGVSWGYRDENFLREHGATRIAHSPCELIPMINDMILNEKNAKG